MTRGQFVAAWEQLKERTGMSSDRLAEMFGYRRRQPERWATGAPVPKLVALTLEWLRIGKIKPEDMK